MSGLLNAPRLSKLQRQKTFRCEKKGNIESDFSLNLPDTYFGFMTAHKKTEAKTNILSSILNCFHKSVSLLFEPVQSTDCTDEPISAAYLDSVRALVNDTAKENYTIHAYRLSE